MDKLVIIASLLTYIFLVLLFVAVCVGFICARIINVYEAKKEVFNAEEKNRILGRLKEVDRWCSHDFPVIEDLVVYTESDFKENISEFRSKIRKKYNVDR